MIAVHEGKILITSFSVRQEKFLATVILLGQIISSLGLQKYCKVKVLQGSDDQTDKNIIPFINAAQNALALLHEPLFNPLSPNIHIQILQTDLYTFP